MYKIQIFHPGSGFYMGTGHESADLDELRRLIESEEFAGPRFQIVDEAGTVVYGPVARPREGDMSVDELAAVMGAPVSTEADLEQLLGFPAGALAEARAVGVQHEIGYSLEAVHCDPLESIVSLHLTTVEGEAINEKVWPDVDFWCAPGGSSIAVQSRDEAEAINEVLGTRFLEFNPSRHRWVFHVHLIGDDE
ncbi:hypothetical protein [Paludisphaera soli]|uniref:hypothetical protein n=1 Tax=Paludisphaera soli TaxID=2712865 RepID=UPI0013EA33FD|nr:hypothetical protein [Paludisphaera soli]